MGVEVKKGPALAFIFLAMMILHTNINICRASVASAAPPVMKKSSNSSRDGCEGPLEGCQLIGDMDSDEELLIMDSDISRRLMIDFRTVTDGTKNPNSPAAPCGPGQAYANCLPHNNTKPQHNEHCSNYKRGRC